MDECNFGIGHSNYETYSEIGKEAIEIVGSQGLERDLSRMESESKTKSNSFLLSCRIMKSLSSQVFKELI